jgi:ABC-type glutathione transport system ATPase component
MTVVRATELHWTRPAAEGGEATHVLRGADLSIEAGEMVTISGPSGTGKSVLGSLVLRLRPLEGPGRVWWGDREVTALPARQLHPLRARFQGLLQQGTAILPPFSTVRSALRETLSEVRGIRGADAKQRIDEVGRLLGISGLLDRRPRYLSGGEKRKSSIARLLLAEPAFAFVDEPDSGLDPVSQHEVMGELRRVLDRTGMGMLVVTHNARLADTYADRRLVLREGVLHAA